MTQISNLAAVNAVVFTFICWGMSTSRNNSAEKLSGISLIALLALTNGALAVKIWMAP